MLSARKFRLILTGSAYVLHHLKYFNRTSTLEASII